MCGDPTVSISFKEKRQNKTQGIQNNEHLALYKAYRFVIYYVKPYRKSEKTMLKSVSPSNIGKCKFETADGFVI